MVKKTNNPLERFNRKLNKKITRHPTLTVLIDALKIITGDYVQTMDHIKYKKYKPMKHLPVPIPKIPEDFAYFKIPK